jgi:uncharacterized protein
VRVSEFHYDNTDVDVNEFVEIEHPASVSINGYQIIFYDGLTGRFSDTITINAITTPPSTGSNGKWYTVIPMSFIDNDLEGIALYNPNTIQLIEFISYEGSFTARNGIASNVASTDIGDSESGNGASTGSIQKCDRPRNNK